MAIICVADGDCTTWAETIPAAAAQGFGLPFENIDPDSNLSEFEVSNIKGLTFITIDDFGAGRYSVLIEDPFQSGLVCSPQGAANNLLGAVPECLDGSDPNGLFLFDIAVDGSSARNFVWRQSQVSVISTGVSGTVGSFIAIEIDTALPFPPSSYPYLTPTNLAQWVTEFGNAVQVGLAANGDEITVNRAACSSVVATNLSVTSTGLTTWDITIEDPFQANLVSDPDDGANNTNGSILDCLGSSDPDATLTIGFTIQGNPYQISVPVTMVTGTATSPNLDGADLVISIDTALPFTTADLANTLQADLLPLDGVTGYPTITLLRCDTIDQAQRIQGTGTVDDPLIPNVVLHPDGSIVCDTNGLRLATSFVPTPQGPTSSPLSGTPAFPPALAGCENWICDTTGNQDWYAPEHQPSMVRSGDDYFPVPDGIAPTAAFVFGSASNARLSFAITNPANRRPMVPRLVVRVQNLLDTPSGGNNFTVIEARATESWTANVYQVPIALFANMYGGADIEDEKSTTFVIPTTGFFGGYNEIPAGENVTYDLEIGQVFGGPAPTWARCVILVEAALFTTA